MHKISIIDIGVLNTPLIKKVISKGDHLVRTQNIPNVAFFGNASFSENFAYVLNESSVAAILYREPKTKQKTPCKYFDRFNARKVLI